MSSKYNKLALAAGFLLALAFSFSCGKHGGDDDNEVLVSSSSSVKSGNRSSSSEITVNPSSSSGKSSSSTNTFVGDSGVFTDSRDGQTYKWVKIKTQIWMAQNLNYNASGQCYDDTPANCEKYGRLYKWEDAMQVCPDGWHLPTRAEWNTLISTVGSDAGKKLRSTSSDWKDGAGTDDYGFGALPGGRLTSKFEYINIEGGWWTSTESDANHSYEKYMRTGSDVRESSYADLAKTNQYSVRCVRYPSSPPIAYGELTDTRDNQTYKTVKIGTQTWMAQNLNYDIDGSKCYNDEPSKCDIYGKLYDWTTAMDFPSKCNSILSTDDADCGIKTPHKGICPVEWHIPSNADWDKLMRSIDGNTDTDSPYYDETAGKHLKSKEGWNDCGPLGSDNRYSCEDTYGFAALPGGYGNFDGRFDDIDDYGNWWTSSEYDSNNAYHRYMRYNRDDTGWYMDNDYWRASWYNVVKKILFSVRCVKN